MKIEVKSAANFLVDLARLNSSGLSDDQLEKFNENVCRILTSHYANHWFPDRPFKGSGYRCIRINGHLDPLIARAGFMMGLACSFLRSLFPSELTMWVDPAEVAYRIGENGSICVLYEEVPPVHPPCTPSPSPPPQPSSPELKTPVKVVTATQQQPQTPQQGPPRSPPPALPHHPHYNAHHHHHHNHQQQQQFSPSKSVVMSPLHQSPPLSPITTSHQQQQQAAMQLSMFLMGGGVGVGKDGGASLVKCKESLRVGLEARPFMERLFVSS